MGDPNAFLIPGTNYVVTSKSFEGLDGDDDDEDDYDLVVGFNLHNNKGQKKYSRVAMMQDDDAWVVAEKWLNEQELSKEKYLKKIAAFLMTELKKKREKFINESKHKHVPLKVRHLGPFSRFCQK